MNIFATSTSAVLSAWALDDVRLRKMLLETAQLLSVAVRLRPELAPSAAGAPLYALGWPHHGCAVWARECQTNFDWLCDHFHELERERRYRFGTPHLTYDKLGKVFITPSTNLARPVTFADCTAHKGEHGSVHDHYKKHLENKWLIEIAKVRQYRADKMLGVPTRKVNPPTWTKTRPPVWATKLIEELAAL